MKKLLATLLVLSMLLCLPMALAEEGGEIASIENTPSYEGTQIALGDTGVVLTIPSDWTVAQAPDGCLCAYMSADGTIGISVMLAQDLDTCYEAASKMVEEGTAKDLMEVSINDNYYMLYTSADELSNYAYLPYSDENCLVIAFGASSADVQSDIPAEILGTAALAEE